MQIASFTGVHRVAVLAAFAAGIVVIKLLPDPETAATTPPAPADPLDSDEQLPVDALAGGCLPFLDRLTAPHDWSLTIARGEMSCGEDTLHDTFDITSAGAVTWTESGVATRRLQLTTAELAVIRNANRIDCVQGDGSSSAWIRVAPGGVRTARDSTYLHAHTQLGIVLTAVLDQAIARYRTARLAAVGPFEFRAVAKGRHGRYRIDVDRAGTVSVHRGKRLVDTSELDDQGRLALIDHALATLAFPPPADREAIRGTLRLGELVIPAVVLRTYEVKASGLWEALANADYAEDE